MSPVVQATMKRKITVRVIAVKMAPNCVIASAQRVAISLSINGLIYRSPRPFAPRKDTAQLFSQKCPSRQ